MDYGVVVLFLVIGGFGGFVCLFVLYQSIPQVQREGRST
jgi:hypothetical protein